MAENTTGPNPEDQDQQQPPASPPPRCTLFGAASAALGTLALLTPFRQQQQREIHILETDLEINHTNIANNKPSESSSSNNSSSSEESNGSLSDIESNNGEEKEEDPFKTIDKEDKDDKDEPIAPTLATKSTMASSVAASTRKKSTSSSKRLSYSLGRIETNFSTTSPNQNDVYNVGVVHP